ncbi:MAG: sigma 54-interacting transcriptional regulator [Desulfomonilaceae bacterium]
MHDEDNKDDLIAGTEQLKSRLQEVEEVLDAIRRSAVDALVVSGPRGDQVYTLTGADQAYRVLFETMNEGAAILGADGTVLFCNSTLSAMLEAPINAILGGSVLRFVAKEDAPSVAALLKKGLEEPQKKEIVLKSRDGSKVPCLISASPFSIDDTSAVCVILTDLTERKSAEEALRQSEQQFRTIFEGAADPIFLKDRSRKYLQVNPAFAKLAGTPASQIIGKRHEDVFDEEVSDHIRSMELRVLEGETIEDEHAKTIRGVPMRVLATRTPLRRGSGEIVGILTILHDITDRNRSEVSTVKATEDYPSKAMRATLNQVKKVAKRASTILLTGESGSGKDYLAKYIHDHSDRSSGPYFSINCAAISPELAESELFGHEKGSFTGAHAKKRGLLELAEGGTLLLNEIGELSPQLQSKLLTFLDTKKFTRVGGEKEISVSARLIAATNRDIKTEVEEGRFGKDLFYRLNVFSIVLPPLRERQEDITTLVQELLASIQTELQIQEIPAIDTAAINALKNYDWPGNVRELRNVLERAVMLSPERISLSSLGLRSTGELRTEDEKDTLTVSFPSDQSLNEVTRQLKRFFVDAALQRSGGSRQGAAQLLGISRHSLKHYMKTLGYKDGDE